MRLRPPILGALALASVILAACGNDVSTSSTGSTGAGGSGGGSATLSTTGGAPGTGGAPVTTSTTSAGGAGGGITCPDTGTACTVCLASACAATYCACYGNLDCSALFECWKTCAPMDVTCLQACEAAHQDGVSTAFLLSDCAASGCASDCPGNKALSDCQKCLFQSCEVQMNACAADPECTALITCAKPCNGDAACVDQCVSLHPGGAPEVTKLSACSKVSCSNVCN